MQRILLTNNHLVQPGGSETWTLTVATELVRRGHDVVVYAPEKRPVRRCVPVPGAHRGQREPSTWGSSTTTRAFQWPAERAAG